MSVAEEAQVDGCRSEMDSWRGAATVLCLGLCGQCKRPMDMVCAEAEAPVVGSASRGDFRRWRPLAASHCRGASLVVAPPDPGLGLFAGNRIQPRISRYSSSREDHRVIGERKKRRKRGTVTRCPATLPGKWPLDTGPAPILGPLATRVLEVMECSPFLYHRE